ncbi:MAG: hypothetical protein ACJAR2_004168 [Ilumatobacter sp.]|jgi:hypothetical protein
MEKLAAVVAIIAAFGLTTAPAADAGVASGGRAELFDEAGMTVTAQCSDMAPVGNAFNADFTARCVNLTKQTYTVGVTDIDGHDVDYAECFTLLRGKPIDLPDARFDFVEGTFKSATVTCTPTRFSPSTN